MTKYEYNKKMYDLALRMSKAKQLKEGSAVSDFYAKAAAGFSFRLDEMSIEEANKPATAVELAFIRNYEINVKAAENA